MSRLNTIDALILLLELQAPIIRSSKTVPEQDLRRAIRALASAAYALDIPVVASVVPLGSAAPVLIEDIGAVAPLTRGTIGVFDDATIRDVIALSDRKVLLLGGVSSEIAILQTVCGARDRGYEVHVLTDCCGGLSERTEATAFRQMAEAGAILSNVSSCLTSFVSDMSTPAGQAVMAALAALWSWELPA